VEVREKL